MLDGYIKLHRKVLSNEMFLEMPFDRWRAFEFLMLNARYKPADIMIKGKTIHLDVGQLIFGEDTLASKWGWSRGKVRRFLEQLESLNMIQRTGTPYGTVITIENYTLYQGERTSNGTLFRTEDCTADGTGYEAAGSTACGTADGTGIKKEKKEKKEKKDKNIIINARAREGEVNLDDESYDDFRERRFTPQMANKKARDMLDKVRSEARQKHAEALKAAMEEEIDL